MFVGAINNSEYEIDYWSLPFFARVCQRYPVFPRVYWRLPEFAEACQSLPAFTGDWRCVPVFDRDCQSLPVFASVSW